MLRLFLSIIYFLELTFGRNPIGNKIQLSESDHESNYYFENIDNNRTYPFTGLAWGEVLKNKNLIKAPIKGNLELKFWGALTEGKVYDLKFITKSLTIAKSYREQELVIWVTKQFIYEFQPPENFDINKMLTHGTFDKLALFKFLALNKISPSKDKTFILCSSKNTNYQDGPWETQIISNNVTCSYMSTHNSGHYREILWKKGKGLTQYSFGFGAGNAGMSFTVKN